VWSSDDAFDATNKQDKMQPEFQMHIKGTRFYCRLWDSGKSVGCWKGTSKYHLFHRPVFSVLKYSNAAKHGSGILVSGKKA
jgi:hypothetical protein